MMATRQAALDRLEEFLPRAGTNYAKHRNFDHGPEDRSNISMLSPYLRHRLITEEEVTRTVLDFHGPRRAEKFLQEVAWRTYWKGWLEMRPTVWSHYLDDLHALRRDAAYEQAVTGRTGLECFDAWANELIEHGYLHNHTRMWFASIWIFTLKLPWQLGADFFMRHLMDADPASNTLSWRWVAGLHTRGKHYLARASNISRFTNGRFNPVGELNESAIAIDEPVTHERTALELPTDPIGHGRVGHLVIGDDLAPPPASLGPMAATAILTAPTDDRGERAMSFREQAMEDARTRYEAEALSDLSPQSLAAWIESERLDAVVCPRPTLGPWRDRLDAVTVGTFVRTWDRQLWPRATAGFFKLKKSLPALFDSLAVAGAGHRGS